MIIRILYFNEFIDWMGVSNAIEKHLGEKAGVLLAVLLKIGSQMVVPLVFCLIYIIAIKRGKRCASKIQKLLGNLQRKRRTVQTTSKHGVKHQLRKPSGF